MTGKTVQRNIKALEGTLKANRSTTITMSKQKARDAIDLYNQRKIALASTSSKMINDLITATTKKNKQKARANHEKLVENHESRKPLGERMEASKKENTENRKGTMKRTYSIEVMFFTYPNGMRTAAKNCPLRTQEKVTNAKATIETEEQARKKIIRDEERQYKGSGHLDNRPRKEYLGKQTLM